MSIYSTVPNKAHVGKQFMSFFGKKQQDFSDINMKWQTEFRSTMSQPILRSYKIERFY